MGTVAVRRQQAADNLQETDKLDMYTKRRQSIMLVTVTKAAALRDLVRNVHSHKTSGLSFVPPLNHANRKDRDFFLKYNIKKLVTQN